MQQNHIADFQLWFFIGCKSYAAHLIAAPDQPPPTIQLQVQQYDAATAADANTLPPSATQASGPLQDQETWSPLLSSPNDPVQASMSLQVNNYTYTAVSHFYASGQPTTLHGRSS